MTRLTIAVAGDPLTFRPVTSSLVRKSKDGNVSVVILLFGSHYNISMAGILQQDSTGDIEDNTKSIASSNSNLELKLEQKSGGATIANLIGTYSSFMYFYPGLKIRGHLKLPITSHVVTVPTLIAEYHFKDLLSKDELIFRLTLLENNLKFDLIETVNTVENILYTEALDALKDEYYFEFGFNINGKSRFYKLDNFETETQTRVRKFIGDLKAKIGECNVSMHGHNSEQVLRILSSDLILLEYPEIFLKFDRTSIERFIGQIKMYDDMNTIVEADWQQIRSRDYKFIGNRVIENGMIRIIINTSNPNIEIWGWNYEALVPVWEKVMTLITDADNGSKSLKIQNIKFEYFSKLQIKADINFGTSVYSLIMTRGDPYITLLNKNKLKFKFKSAKNRMGADFTTGNYNLSNTFINGNPTVRALSTETLSGFTLNDNYFGIYNDSDINAIVGWMSNIVQSTSIKIDIVGSDTEYEFTYPRVGNIFGIGVLPSFPTNLVGGVPFPFVVGTQDKYIKWLANESVLSFRELETIKRR